MRLHRRSKLGCDPGYWGSNPHLTPIMIPISEAKKLAETYDYDKVIIIAIKDNVKDSITSYGATIEHNNMAHKIGEFLRYRVFGWVKPPIEADITQ